MGREGKGRDVTGLPAAGERLSFGPMLGLKNRPRAGMLALLALPLLLAGCGNQMIETFTNDAEQARALGHIEDMRRGEFAALEAKFDPGIFGMAPKGTMERMSKAVPNGEPTERKLVGVNKSVWTDGTIVNLTYQFRFGEQYVLIKCATNEKQDGAYTIVGMNVNPLEGSLDEMHAFTLSGKTPVHYAVLLLAITFPLLSIVALYFCAREKGLKRRWLWVLMIIFGVTQFSLDWTSGGWSFSPLSLLLFSASAAKPLYGPLILGVALPVGAIAYFLRRRNSPDTAVSNLP
jgi:hypothetical protein